MQFFRSAELVTAKGGRVPASIRRIGPDRVFAPEKPLPAGQELVLHYRATGWHVDTCGRPHHVPVGEHTLTADSHLVGYDATVATVSTRLTFECGTSLPRPASTFDAPPEAHIPSARPAPSTSPTPSRGTSSFSCALEHHAPEQQTGSAVLVFVLLLAARRWIPRERPPSVDVAVTHDMRTTVPAFRTAPLYAP